MFSYHHLKEMVGISNTELLEIQDHQTLLQKHAKTFEKNVTEWLASFEIHCAQEDPEIMLPEYFRTIISGEYDYEFYMMQYRQAMHWRLCGLNQSRSLLLMSHIRKLFIMYAETAESYNLAKGLCIVMDMSQSIVATVYHIAEEVQRMRTLTDNELKYIQRSFSLISMTVPEELVRPYKDHQEWKFLAFSAAIGEKIDASHLALSHTTCRLGQWLETKGEKLIAEKESVNFHHAHKHFHQLGKLISDYADLKQPERILDLLIEMESASQIVSDTLLNVIEDEFIRLATSDALTGMPNRGSFDIDFEKNIAFAERHNYWVGLVLIDIDHFKKINDELGHLVGDHALKDVANVIRKTARLEETTYRWGGEEFAVLALDNKPGGAEQLAERIRTTIEQQAFHSADGSANTPLRLTVSCGSVCFRPPSERPIHEIFALVDKQLYLAKESGRNRIEHLTIHAVNACKET